MTDVRKLVVGTAAFAPTYAGQVGLSFDEASTLALDALRAEIQWFDTAPAYGNAEQVLGQAVAWRPNCAVATKVAGDLSVADVRASISNSQIALGVYPDAVLIHNATVAQLAGPVMQELRYQQAHGSIDLVGASVYDEDEALAAIAAHCDIVEVPFNLLDQRMAKRVFPEALKAGVGIWVRSVWMRGALAPWGLAPAATAHAADDVRNRLWCADFSALADVALRFVLGFDAVVGVVIGPRTRAELQQAVAAAEKGPLGIIRRLLATSLPEWGPEITDPRRWK